MNPLAPPVRVAHVVLSLEVGGLERMVVDLVKGLDRESFAPTVFVLGPLGPLADELAAHEIPVTSVPRRPGKIDPQLPLRLARLFTKAGTGLVHTHNPAPHLYGALGASITRSNGRRLCVVHTKHGRNVPHTRRSVLMNQLASGLTERIVAVSDDARAVATDVEGVAARKVVTVHNGVDTDRYRPRADGGRARAEARAALGLPAEGYEVVCVARLSEEKDHATLLDAFALLRATTPHAGLTLIGDGPERAALEARAASLPPGAVRFLGMRSDVADLLPAFDAFTLASRTEGIALTLLEAAAAGLPIVATRVGGNPEVVLHGATGLLVGARAPEELAAALGEVARRPDRSEMGRRGRRRVEERFGLGAMIEAYEGIYLEVLGTPRCKVPSLRTRSLLAKPPRAG